MPSPSLSNSWKAFSTFSLKSSPCSTPSSQRGIPLPTRSRNSYTFFTSSSSHRKSVIASLLSSTEGIRLGEKEPLVVVPLKLPAMVWKRASGRSFGYLILAAVSTFCFGRGMGPVRKKGCTWWYFEGEAAAAIPPELEPPGGPLCDVAAAALGLALGLFGGLEEVIFGGGLFFGGVCETLPLELLLDPPTCALGLFMLAACAEEEEDFTLLDEPDDRAAGGPELLVAAPFPATTPPCRSAVGVLGVFLAMISPTAVDTRSLVLSCATSSRATF
mmetsp:Transcript_25501/g.64276  ORF Transcript_25501/g.64276 Transcript_25501/m.64276 type:complete len:273 (-) Transcript_25501:760-1578(-)